jgi:hypothetical protein
MWTRSDSLEHIGLILLCRGIFMGDDQDFFRNDIPSEPTYDIGNAKTIDRSSLPNVDAQTQMAAMENWFWANYEDPAENTPYVGSEGGYQFIHGGPFNAREELEGEFANLVAEDAFRKSCPVN